MGKRSVISPGTPYAAATSAPGLKSTKIVLIAGRVRPHDRLGHHDYAAGCALLAALLRRVPGVDTVEIKDGWPDDESIIDGAAAILFYEGGGGKQAFLQSEARVARVQKAVDDGAGLVVIHQAIAFPAGLAERGKAWLGGVYINGESVRGHWKSEHRAFPSHVVTRGVPPWKADDGWMSHIRFVESMRGVTPLLWSGKRHGGSPEGGVDDVVAWIYERPRGGRSFTFTGLDAHSAWLHDGLRFLVGNGVLWAAGLEPPQDPSWMRIDPAVLATYLTRRKLPAIKLLLSLCHKAGRALRGERKW